MAGQSHFKRPREIRLRFPHVTDDTLLIWAEHCAPLGRAVRTRPDPDRRGAQLYHVGDVARALSKFLPSEKEDEFNEGREHWIWLPLGARRFHLSLHYLTVHVDQKCSRLGGKKFQVVTRFVRRPTRPTVRSRTYATERQLQAMAEAERIATDGAAGKTPWADASQAKRYHRKFTRYYLRRCAEKDGPAKQLIGRGVALGKEFRKRSDASIIHHAVWLRQDLQDLAEKLNAGSAGNGRLTRDGAADALGVAVGTVRYYVRVGMLKERNGFDPAEVESLKQERAHYPRRVSGRTDSGVHRDGEGTWRTPDAVRRKHPVIKNGRGSFDNWRLGKYPCPGHRTGERPCVQQVRIKTGARSHLQWLFHDDTTKRIADALGGGLVTESVDSRGRTMFRGADRRLVMKSIASRSNAPANAPPATSQPATDTTERAPAKPRRGKGRPSVSEAEAREMLDMLDDYKRFRDAGGSRQDFCDDRDIEIDQLEKARDWKRTNARRNKLPLRQNRFGARP